VVLIGLRLHAMTVSTTPPGWPRWAGPGSAALCIPTEFIAGTKGLTAPPIGFTAEPKGLAAPPAGKTKIDGDQTPHREWTPETRQLELQRDCLQCH
jgi:hypothetical protein